MLKSLFGNIPIAFDLQLIKCIKLENRFIFIQIHMGWKKNKCRKGSKQLFQKRKGSKQLHQLLPIYVLAKQARSCSSLPPRIIAAPGNGRMSAPAWPTSCEQAGRQAGRFVVSSPRLVQPGPEREQMGKRLCAVRPWRPLEQGGGAALRCEPKRRGNGRKKSSGGGKKGE